MGTEHDVDLVEVIMAIDSTVCDVQFTVRHLEQLLCVLGDDFATPGAVDEATRLELLGIIERFVAKMRR